MLIFASTKEWVNETYWQNKINSNQRHKHTLTYSFALASSLLYALCDDTNAKVFVILVISFCFVICVIACDYEVQRYCSFSREFIL